MPFGVSPASWEQILDQVSDLARPLRLDAEDVADVKAEALEVREVLRPWSESSSAVRRCASVGSSLASLDNASGDVPGGASTGEGRYLALTWCWPSWRCGTHGRSPRPEGSRSGTWCSPSIPPPGFGGLLLGAVVAAHLRGVDEELVPDLYRLVNEIERGQRVVQPRLRHRYQVDRHGLARSTHRLTGRGRGRSASSSRTTARRCSRSSAPSTPSSGSAPDVAAPVAGVLHRALRWNGPVGTGAHLPPGRRERARGSSLTAFVDPVAWALDVLGFPPGTVSPVKRDVIAPYRVRLMRGAPRPRRRRDRRQQVHRRPRRGPPHPAAADMGPLMAAASEAARVGRCCWRPAPAPARSTPSLVAIEAAVRAASRSSAWTSRTARPGGRRRTARPSSSTRCGTTRQALVERAAHSARAARARRPVDGRAHVLDGGRRRTPRRRPRPHLLSAAPAGPAGQPADGPPARPHRALPVRPGHPRPLRLARRAHRGDGDDPRAGHPRVDRRQAATT